MKSKIWTLDSNIAMLQGAQAVAPFRPNFDSTGHRPGFTKSDTVNLPSLYLQVTLQPIHRDSRDRPFSV